jgi:hypothetical protein
VDLSGLALGLETALQWENVLVCLIGVTLGTAVGVLPGIGPTATVALLLPITFNFDPGGLADHAGRHLLRRPVRRVDDGNSAQPPG